MKPCATACMMVVVGKGWQKTIETFIAELGSYLHLQDQKRVYFAEDIQAAVDLINTFEKDSQKS